VKSEDFRHSSEFTISRGDPILLIQIPIPDHLHSPNYTSQPRTTDMAQRVLITGANGYVGSHVLQEFLAKGISVRSIVRSQAKAEQVLSDFPNYGSRLDFGIVPDITTPGAFDEVVKSTPPFDIVIHTASPFLYKVISSNLEFLDPAIKGTLEILKSVKAHAPTVKRVVITSSCAAVVNFGADPFSSPKKVYTEDDWNSLTWDDALAGTSQQAYLASKKFAEKAGKYFSISARFPC
jgi:nucleoside-diphosphate-sugar epimerase